MATAFSGLLGFDFTVFALSTYRSIKLGRHNEPFLNRLFVDGTFVKRIPYKELTQRDNAGIVYYGVTWSVNLANIIVLVVRYVQVLFPVSFRTKGLTSLRFQTADPSVDLSTPVFANIVGNNGLTAYDQLTRSNAAQFDGSERHGRNEPWLTHWIHLNISRRHPLCARDSGWVEYGTGYAGSASRKCAAANAAPARRPLASGLHKGIHHASTYAQVR
ncbi:hypothetical protein EDB89DRAFT_1194846 [Lactarius sanguifluus]|nr:hypothetical protein EDB89DRAFT_1194846 [Lactarius sanguifluus]